MLAVAGATQRYERCIETSKRVRWDIDADVIRGRCFSGSESDHHFLPEGLSRVGRIEFLRVEERRLLSQIQGRTYANMFGLVERFIAAKMLEISRTHWFGDQVALEALVRFTDQELKHQALFRRLEQMIDDVMPIGYEFTAQANDVADAVMKASSWAVLALTCHIELFTQGHYRQSIEPDADLSPLFKDVFLYHWKEESQHAIVDELEWARENASIGPAQRDKAVLELIGLIQGIDLLLQAQAGADSNYFLRICGRTLTHEQTRRIAVDLLSAYRWQYIVSGVQEPRFSALLNGMIDDAQRARIAAALQPICAPA